MTKIYVIQGTKEVMQKMFEQFFRNELLLEHSPFFFYIMLTFKVIIYIFAETIRQVLHSFKNENFFSTCYVWRFMRSGAKI